MSTTMPDRRRSKLDLSSQLFLALSVVAVANFVFLRSLVQQNENQSGGGGRMLSAADESMGQVVDIDESTTSLELPYYLQGKTQYKKNKFHHRKTFEAIIDEQSKPIDLENDKVWVLADPVKTPTRNHESVLLEYGPGNNKQVLVNVLGRFSRVVQWMDLETGEQYEVKTTGKDPDGRPLNDLNHVASVLVDSTDYFSYDHDTLVPKKEIWLPCGFHNDKIGKEQSSTYVRIIDLETMEVRSGPKIPYSGGACGAALIDAMEGEAPLICAFGGTDGNHDSGIFLPYVSCYDRKTAKWVYPFGKLPVGMDHLSVAVVPKSACHPNDPARVLMFNYRTKNYSTHTSAEILAFDIPKDGWTRQQLDDSEADTPGNWYTFANHTFEGEDYEVYAPRDASAVVMANEGRSIINFGGINQVRNEKFVKGDKTTGPKVFSTWFSMVRELDVCERTWSKVADMGIQTFAIMASASTKLNSAFFCGGSMFRQDFKGNTQWCVASHIPGIDFWNHRIDGLAKFADQFEPGRLAKLPVVATDVQ